MKKTVCLLICAGFVILSGCYSTSLDRKPAPRRKARPAPKKVVRPKGEDSVDPMFDVFFRSKPQKHESSSLSDSESRYIRKQRQEDDAVVRSVRGGGKLKENTKQKDWVFGTDGGKYF